MAIQSNLLAHAQRAWNDGECEEALDHLLNYAEGRAGGIIPEHADDEATFDDLWCDVMRAYNAAVGGMS